MEVAPRDGVAVRGEEAAHRRIFREMLEEQHMGGKRDAAPLLRPLPAALDVHLFQRAPRVGEEGGVLVLLRAARRGVRRRAAVEKAQLNRRVDVRVERRRVARHPEVLWYMDGVGW